jgi:hypothetical protein
LGQIRKELISSCSCTRTTRRLLVITTETSYATRYHERKCNSNFNQFKKLSKAVLKYIGVEDNAGEPPSGDSDKAVWLEGCRDAFCDRYPDMKNLLDSMLLVKELLQESPKWEAFEKKKEEALE